MSETITITYIAKGCPLVRIVLTDQDWVKVCAWCEARLFPGMDVRAQNLAADRIVSRLKAKKK